MEKKVILLVCSTGLSAQVLLEHMSKVVQGKKIQVELLSCGFLELDNYLETRKIDILLLAPHIRSKQKQCFEKIASKAIQIDMIKMTDYGLMDGERVLDHIKDLLV